MVPANGRASSVHRSIQVRVLLSSTSRNIKLYFRKYVHHILRVHLVYTWKQVKLRQYFKLLIKRLRVKPNKQPLRSSYFFKAWMETGPERVHNEREKDTSEPTTGGTPACVSGRSDWMIDPDLRDQ